MKFSMPSAFKRRDARGLVACAVAGVLVAVTVNALIFGLDYGATHDPGPRDQGPINEIVNTIVPFVWLALFGAMGASMWLIQRDRDRVAGATVLVAALLASCALYPVYTLGFTSTDLGIAGNWFTALLAALAVGASWRHSKAASLLLVPIVIWVTIASVGIYRNASGRPF